MGDDRQPTSAATSKPKRSPRKPGHRPPAAVVIEPTLEHTHSVVFLHGLYCSGNDFDEVPNLLSELGGNPGAIRWIYPNAPKRTIDWPAGAEENVAAWYNYHTDKSGTMEHDTIDEDQLKSAAASVISLLGQEAAKFGGDWSRLILGGNSQGGTVASFVAATCGRKLGGLLW